MAVKPKPIPQEEDAGVFSIYIGPSLRGGITKGQIFKMNKKAALASIASLVEKHPLIADLLVDGNDLPAAKVRLAQSNSLMHRNYEKLAKGQG